MEIFFYLLLFIIASSVASAFGKTGRNLPGGPRWPTSPQPGAGWPQTDLSGTGLPRMDPPTTARPPAETRAALFPEDAPPIEVTAEETTDMTDIFEQGPSDQQMANPQGQFGLATGIVAMEVLGRPRSLRPWRNWRH